MNTTTPTSTATASAATAAGSAPAVLPTALSDVELYLLVTGSGACRSLERPDDMFPDPSDQLGIERATRVCAGCPVRAACREYAGRNGAEYGVWGGELLGDSDHDAQAQEVAS